MKYQGHKNYNHWNVSLWIGNDEGLYFLALDCIRNNKNKDNAAIEMLERLFLNNVYETPDGVPFTKTTIRYSMVGL